MSCQVWDPPGRSQAEEMASLPDEERLAFLDSLTPVEEQELLSAWDFWARPKQRIPWALTGGLVFPCLGGRGFGKTRMGREGVLEIVPTYPEPKKLRIGIVGPTAADCRDVQ